MVAALVTTDVSVSTDKEAAAEGPLGMDGTVHMALDYSLGSAAQLPLI